MNIHHIKAFLAPLVQQFMSEVHIDDFGFTVVQNEVLLITIKGEEKYKAMRLSGFSGSGWMLSRMETIENKDKKFDIYLKDVHDSKSLAVAIIEDVIQQKIFSIVNQVKRDYPII